MEDRINKRISQLSGGEIKEDIKYIEKTKIKKKQKGGLPPFRSSGSFSAMVDDMVGMLESGVHGIIDGFKAGYSILTLPTDLYHDLERPNPPLPENTPI